MKIDSNNNCVSDFCKNIMSELSHKNYHYIPITYDLTISFIFIQMYNLLENGWNSRTEKSNAKFVRIPSKHHFACHFKILKYNNVNAVCLVSNDIEPDEIVIEFMRNSRFKKCLKFHGTNVKSAHYRVISRNEMPQNAHFNLIKKKEDRIHKRNRFVLFILILLWFLKSIFASSILSMYEKENEYIFDRSEEILMSECVRMEWVSKRVDRKLYI